MRKQLFTLGMVAVVAIALATPASAANRGATFTPIGLFPICTPETPPDEFCENFPLTTAVSMTADGSTVAGMHAFFQGVYVWTAETGVQTLGPTSGAPYLSRDGSALASDPFLPPDYLFDQNAYWTGGFWPNATWDPIPLAPGYAICGSSAQGVFGISDDGDTTVGLTWIDYNMDGSGCEGASGFSANGGVVTVLDNSVNDDSTRANAVNADGSVIIGWMQTNTREASKWVDGVQSFLCPSPVGAGGDNFCTEGWDVTPDGSLMLTSMATPADFNTRATLVDQAGNYEQLPFPDAPFDPFWDSFSGWAVSDDGNTVVGEFGGGGFFGSPPYPVLWNRDLGMTIDVHVFLLGQGLDDLFFWFLEDATTVNSDGTIIAGSGTNPDGWIEAWTADISKVKVCHKPDGQGQGNHRTIAIAWGSVPDHLAHGDDLSTCEFAADGGIRAFQNRRLQAGGMSADDDQRMDLNLPGLVGTNPFSNVEIPNPYQTVESDDEASTQDGGQSVEQREQLQRRIRRQR
jgi:hypothetical protein